MAALGSVAIDSEEIFWAFYEIHNAVLNYIYSTILIFDQVVSGAVGYELICVLI